MEYTDTLRVCRAISKVKMLQKRTPFALRMRDRQPGRFHAARQPLREGLPVTSCSECKEAVMTEAARGQRQQRRTCRGRRNAGGIDEQLNKKKAADAPV